MGLESLALIATSDMKNTKLRQLVKQCKDPMQQGQKISRGTLAHGHYSIGLHHTNY